MPILTIIASVLLPPREEDTERGLGSDFWINCLLTLLGYVPGVVHALWVVLRARP
jgi:uncharacterized membrane protein YqaE (UPF0057 family)